MTYRTVFLTRVLQMGVRIIFLSKETTDSMMLFHDFGHLCFGLLVHRMQVLEQWHPSLFGAVICDADEPLFRKILRKLWSHLSRYLLEAQLGLCTSGIEVPTPHSLDDISPSVKQSGLCCCLSVSDSLLFAFDFVQLPRWNCLKLFPFLVHCSFCIRNFILLGASE